MANDPPTDGKSPGEKPQLQILHLEDDPLDAELIEAQLQRAGIFCQMTRVASRVDFLEALEQSRVDLILSDSNLPAFDGFSALKLAGEQCPGTPFIFVSGDESDDAAREALVRGADDYVYKGDLSRLIAIVKTAFSRPSREDNEHPDTTPDFLLP